MLLENYLSENFPDLKLKAPLFYHQKFGLRFEVAIPTLNPVNIQYFIEADKRTIKLFESVFDLNDEVIIVCQRYSDGRQKIKKNSFCYKYIDNYSQVESYKIQDPYFSLEDKDLYNKKDHWHQLAIHTNISSVNYSKFLWRSIRYDFGYGGIETYFINKTKNIIFHNYDDRGLDIIAKDKKTLMNIYLEFNDWILDYDREKIDLVFKN